LIIYILIPQVLSPFRGVRIAYHIDRDSYAGWSLYTPVRATQARQVEGPPKPDRLKDRGQTK